MPQFLIPEIPILESIIRPIIVYLFLLIAIRLFGKRELGSMTPFDLIVLLTISNVLQNAMIGPDNSLTGGLIGGTTIFVANAILARLTYRFPSIAWLAQGHPTVLIENGIILQQNLAHELVSLEDLREGLSKNQVDMDTELATVRRAELEPDGSVTVTRNLGAARGVQARRRGKMRRVN